jgi:hypothetical protein
LGKNKTFVENIFSWKFKMAELFNLKDDIFQKMLRFYYRTTAEWNVLILWYAVVLMIKKIVGKLKNQNGGLIQGGDDFFLFFT